MWVPVYDEEWDGDDPLGLERPITPPKDSESGVVTFKGDDLPWSVGRYEVNHPRDQHMLHNVNMLFRFGTITMESTM
jgi:phosphatidylethanolamine N-methyltransferase